MDAGRRDSVELRTDIPADVAETLDAESLAVGRHHKAVDWALTFLRAVRLVEASQDARCSRYLRYRAAAKGGEER